MADLVLKVAWIIKSVTNAREPPSLDLEIIFLHSMWLWSNYFDSSKTLIGVIRIQTSVFSCLEKLTNPKRLRNSPKLLQASHLLPSTWGCFWTQLFNYSSNPLNNTRHKQRTWTEQLQSCHVKSLSICLNRILKVFVVKGKEITLIVFSCKHHNLGILRGNHFTPLFFHPVFSNSCWCFHHSCLYLIMKGGTIRPPHSTLHHPAGPLWMLYLHCFSWCCLKALSMSDISTTINWFMFIPYWFSFNLIYFLTCMTFTFFLAMHFLSRPHTVKYKEQLLHSSTKTHTHTHTL